MVHLDSLGAKPVRSPAKPNFSFWHKAEDFGTATGPTVMQRYNGRAESVGPMPAPDQCQKSNLLAAPPASLR
jgi:hypothetical protein